jgi:hypothetical protein
MPQSSAAMSSTQPEALGSQGLNRSGRSDKKFEQTNFKENSTRLSRFLQRLSCTKPTINDESRRVWGIIKDSLPLWTGNDVHRWGEPLLCDIFSVLGPPVASTARFSTTSGSHRAPRLQMISFCVLFTTKLAFFLPRYHFHDTPDSNSIFTLVGVIDVQRDISNPQITPAKHALCNNSADSINKLEFFATYGDTQSRSIEQRVRFVSVRTNWSVGDRTRDWEMMMKELLRSPCETRLPGDRRSFLLSQVDFHHCTFVNGRIILVLWKYISMTTSHLS